MAASNGQRGGGVFCNLSAQVPDDDEVKGH